MTLVCQTEPAGGRDIVHDALAQRTHRAKHLSVLRGAPQTGKPLPAYQLSRDDISIANPLSAAKMIGWRYPVVGGTSPALVSLVGQPGALTFAGLSHGPLPERLLEAAVLAEDNLASQTDAYEPRLLEIPSLKLCALWLRGPNDQNFFISLIDGNRSSLPPLQLERSIQLRMDAALAERRARLSLARSGAAKMPVQNAKRQGSAITVNDIRVGETDSAGAVISKVYARASPSYAIYRTPERVVIQYADNPATAADQRRHVASLNGLRTQIDGLIDGWRQSRVQFFKNKAAKYDGGVAAALTLCLEGDDATPLRYLNEIKADIVDERTSWGRFEYLIAASLFSVAAIAFFFGLKTHHFFNPSADSVWLAARGGIVGAFFSIALAIRTRTVLTNLRRRDNIADAMLRITVGAISASILILLIKANMLPDFQVGGAKLSTKDVTWEAILIVGFVAGFLERLVPDLLAKAQTTAPPAPPQPQIQAPHVPPGPAPQPGQGAIPQNDPGAAQLPPPGPAKPPGPTA